MANNVVVLTDSCVKEDEVNVKKFALKKQRQKMSYTQAEAPTKNKSHKRVLKHADTWLKLANA